jgi:alkanesulfonate monooxygenase SsuD/methylene tetrahydromethanopterin reductase-like flavin-dependent oxidoreductase (luciferase family)
LGDGWFTVAPTFEKFFARRRKIEECAKKYDRDGEKIPSILFATFHLSTNDANADEEGWSLAESYFRQPRSNLGHLSPFFGTPETIARKLQAYVDVGLTAIVARLVASDARTQIRLVMNELRPRLSARQDAKNAKV